MELTAKVRDDDDGMLWAEVEELPGCFASGESISELLEAITEAVSLYLAQPGGAAGPVPGPIPRVASFGMRVQQRA